MQINVTYDASVSGAPAGFTQAVQAAVQFYETAISSNVTINLAFGWGEVHGEVLDPNAVAETISNYRTNLTYQSVKNALIAANSSAPAAELAALSLPSVDPTNNGNFWVTTAEAKVLGLYSNTSTIDGYIGLASNLSYAFDPANRGAPGAYDAIGTLEHEIAHALGRAAMTSEPSPNNPAQHLESPLDLFRFAAANIHTYQPGGAYFSLNGDQFIKPFNDGSNGGDGDDWAGSGTVDAYDAFATLGVASPVSTADIRLLQVLGYDISTTASTPTGTPTAQLLLTQDGSLASGQSLTFNGPAALVFSPTGVQTGPSYTNAGTITDSGTAAQIDVIGVQYDPNDPVDISVNAVSTFTNAVSGVLSVKAVADASDALGIYFGPNLVVNSGQIQVASAAADAWGDIGIAFTNTSTGTLTVQGWDHATGLDFRLNASSVAASNAGTIAVSGLHAIGVETASSFDNSGALTVTPAGYGADSTGVDFTTPFAASAGSFAPVLTNSGVITAQVAVQVGSTFSPVIINTGTINGDLHLVGFSDTLDSHAGTIHGTILLGTGVNTVALGGEGDTIALTVGGSDTITLGAGADVLTVLPVGAPQAGVVINNFQAGVGGDRLNIASYVNAFMTHYPANADPVVQGFLRLFQSGSDTLVQVDSDGGGDSFQTVVTLKGVSPFALTSANFDGLRPTSLVNTGLLTSPASGGTLTGGAGDDVLQGNAGPDILYGGGGANILNGGGGLNTALFDGALRAYTVSVNGAGVGTVRGGPEGASDSLFDIQRLQFVDGYLTTSTTDTAGQVYRIYEATLGRAPDPVGLANWVHLLNGGQSLQSVVDGFVGSTEFQTVYGPLTNNAFVTLLYYNVLHRAPDQGGLTNWLNYIGAGHSRAEVVLGFSESAEDIAALAAPVQQGLWVQDAGAAEVARMYDTAFGRLPDAAGLITWTGLLDKGTDTLLQVAQGFTGSTEFASVYGGLDDSHFVNQLYLNTLHRAADQSGLANWVNFLAAGHSRAEVVIGFSESAEHIANAAAHIDQGVWFT